MTPRSEGKEKYTCSPKVTVSGNHDFQVTVCQRNYVKNVGTVSQNIISFL